MNDTHIRLLELKIEGLSKEVEELQRENRALRSRSKLLIWLYDRLKSRIQIKLVYVKTTN